MTLELTDFPTLQKSAFMLEYYFEDRRSDWELCVRTGLEGRKQPIQEGPSPVERDFRIGISCHRMWSRERCGDIRPVLIHCSGPAYAFTLLTVLDTFPFHAAFLRMFLMV